jgi:hypothetical protein
LVTGEQEASFSFDTSVIQHSEPLLNQKLRNSEKYLAISETRINELEDNLQKVLLEKQELKEELMESKSHQKQLKDLVGQVSFYLLFISK